MNINYSPPNVLVVDDVNSNLTLFTEIIHNAGYIARPVASAKQAVSAIEAMLPNLILLDISMPDMDGFEFCSILKKNVMTRGIPIIFISEANTIEVKVKCFESGAVDFIAKPFEPEELILRIGLHLKMYNMRQELEIYNKKLNKIINDQISRIYEEQKNLINALVKLSLIRLNSSEIRLDRLGKNCRLLAMSLQFSPIYKNQITNSFIDAIEVTSRLRDIGAIAASDSILKNPANLNEQEIKEMEKHTIIGAEILEDLYSQNKNNELLKMAVEIIRYHHENWDGSGYPEGLKEKQIPLSARIVAIVDSYENLISETKSRMAYSHENSVKMINNGSGKLFDPDIIRIFNKIHNQLVN